MSLRRTTLAIAAGIFLLHAGPPASAQTLPGLAPGLYFEPPSRYIDKEAEREADRIKEQNYRTGQVGQQGGLNLDLGNFRRPEDEDFPEWRGLNDLANERASSYSGARVRIPLGGADN
ncbi:MAG: hypothetical protein D6773_09080 [Alphaproteobacteria bacterium]|nr:MAG: hypothetical protein D6773_09080 [Alphaproteobacteria bacterium]